MQLRALVVAALVMAGIACTPPCEPTTTLLGELCHRGDAGAIAADASFVLEGRPGNYGTTCEVSVADGGILLEVTGTLACDARSGAGLRAAPRAVACTVPPLPAGTYRVIAEPEVTLTIPGGTGIPPCF